MRQSWGICQFKLKNLELVNASTYGSKVAVLNWKSFERSKYSLKLQELSRLLLGTLYMIDENKLLIQKQFFLKLRGYTNSEFPFEFIPLLVQYSDEMTIILLFCLISAWKENF